MSSFRDLHLDQRRIFVDTVQAYQAFQEAKANQGHYAGGMHWKRVGGREYLIRTRGGHGQQHSLGPRSAETEAIYREFRAGKDRAEEAFREQKESLQYQARLARAAGLGRVPATVADVTRIIARDTRMARHVRIVGTNALYAYEALAGVHLATGLVATRDADPLWDNRDNMRVAGPRSQGLLGYLRQADRTFEVMQNQPFRAVNQKGFMADLVAPMPNPPHKETAATMGHDDQDLARVEVPGLAWLVSAPRVSQVAIDERGYPVELPVPGPRVFALHKIWLASQADRDPVKKERDRAQGMAVVKLIEAYLPDHAFREEDLMMLPDRVRDLLPRVDEPPLPPGMEPDE